MELTKITLSEQIYERLQHDIILGSIEAGSRLTINDLKNEFGVSSTPVRDALHRLAQEGFVSHNGNQGAQVVDPSEKEMRDISNITALHDSYALHLSINGPNREAMLVDLKKELDICKRHVIDGKHYEDWWKHDNNFHRCFYMHMDNDLLFEISSKYRGIFSILTRKSADERTVNQRYLEHERLYKALESNDEEAAQGIMDNHFSTGMQDVNVSMGFTSK